MLLVTPGRGVVYWLIVQVADTGHPLLDVFWYILMQVRLACKHFTVSTATPQCHMTHVSWKNTKSHFLNCIFGPQTVKFKEY